MSIDAMKQALAALENSQSYVEFDWVKNQCGRAITALRAAIEQTNDWDEVEALRASLREHMAEIHRLRAAIEQAQGKHEDWCASLTQLLLSMPPKPAPCNCKSKTASPRQWQGLTDEEIAEIAATPAAIPGAYVHSFARAIEARLKEKNA